MPERKNSTTAMLRGTWSDCDHDRDRVWRHTTCRESPTIKTQPSDAGRRLGGAQAVRDPTNRLFPDELYTPANEARSQLARQTRGSNDG